MLFILFNKKKTYMCIGVTIVKLNKDWIEHLLATCILTQVFELHFIVVKIKLIVVRA